MLIMQITFGVLGYFVVGGLVAGIVTALLERSPTLIKYLDSDIIFMSVLFWPLALVVVIVIVAMSLARDAVEAWYDRKPPADDLGEL
jgi:uncharacterized membrane protein